VRTFASSRATSWPDDTGGSPSGEEPCPLACPRMQAGSKRREGRGHDCHEFYALKGTFSSRERSRIPRRYGIFHPLWTPSMIFLVRWYAGTLPPVRPGTSGPPHFLNICTVAAHVRDGVSGSDAGGRGSPRLCRPGPANLTPPSATLIDGDPPRGADDVHVTDGPGAGEGVCPRRNRAAT